MYYVNFRILKFMYIYQVFYVRTMIPFDWLPSELHSPYTQIKSSSALHTWTGRDSGFAISRAHQWCLSFIAGSQVSKAIYSARTGITTALPSSAQATQNSLIRFVETCFFLVTFSRAQEVGRFRRQNFSQMPSQTIFKRRINFSTRLILIYYLQEFHNFESHRFNFHSKPTVKMLPLTIALHQFYPTGWQVRSSGDEIPQNSWPISEKAFIKTSWLGSQLKPKSICHNYSCDLYLYHL